MRSHSIKAGTLPESTRDITMGDNHIQQLELAEAEKVQAQADLQAKDAERLQKEYDARWGSFDRELAKVRALRSAHEVQKCACGGCCSNRTAAENRQLKEENLQLKEALARMTL